MKNIRTRRILAGILILTTILSVAGCGNKETKKRSKSRKSTRQSATDVAEPPADTLSTPTPTQAPTPTPDQPGYASLQLSNEYLVGFDYCSYELMSSDPVIFGRVRYDGKIEADFDYRLANGERRTETKIFDLTDEQFSNIQSGIHLKELYELDPEEADPEETYDGGCIWLFIYGKDGEVIKACGGFCPHNKQFNAMHNLIHENLPEEFLEEYEYCCRKEETYQQFGWRGYGVFLSEKITPSDIRGYGTIVIDAQEYTYEEIQAFRAEEMRVYSYLNVGSLENFRDYYDEYKDLCLGKYEHWDDEQWIDVTSERWQAFILEELAPSIVEKGCDGFFVDNCDVYYQYPTEEVLRALGTIMEGLVDTKLEVIMNGGDAFIDAYTTTIGPWTNVISGINQETVFTKIDWDTGTFRARNSSDNEFLFYTEYIERYAEQGVYIYLIEYTQNAGVQNEVIDYCREHNFMYLLSPTLELG